MSKEIERKFLLKEDFKISSLLYCKRSVIEDVYLNDNTRLRNKDGKLIITIKKGEGISRDEYEFLMEVGDLNVLQSVNLPVLNKIRLVVPYCDHDFEINIFDKILFKKKPLILVEVELKSEDEKFLLPEWLGEEVTNDERFYGFNLFKLLKYQDFEVK